MNAKLVSVVIPTFNRANLIEECINSVLSQTYSNIEIIVCDDASTDNTETKVNKLQSISAKKIHYIKFLKNKGPSAARNAGMNSATGEYIAFLDSDDLWLPAKLEREIEKLEKEGKDISLSGSIRIVKSNNVNNDSIKIDLPDSDWELETVKKFCTGEISFATPCLVFRKSLLAESGFLNQDLRRSEDLDFFLRLICHGKLSVIRQELSIIRTRLSNQRGIFFETRDSNFHWIEILKLNRHKLDAKLLNILINRIVLYTADVAIRDGRYLEFLKLLSIRLKMDGAININDVRRLIRGISARMLRGG